MKEVARVAVFSVRMTDRGEVIVPQRKLGGFHSIERAREAVAELARVAVTSVAKVGVFDRQGMLID